MERMLYLQISEARMEEMRNEIVEILRESGAKCGLLIDSSGYLLIRKGFSLIQEIESLCALIAASRASTREIARILDQEEISVIYHQGSGDHIHSTDVGKHAILTLIFDDRADLATIRKVVTQRIGVIDELLNNSLLDTQTRTKGIQNLRDNADKTLDALFQGEEGDGSMADTG